MKYFTTEMAKHGIVNDYEDNDRPNRAMVQLAKHATWVPVRELRDIGDGMTEQAFDIVLNKNCFNVHWVGSGGYWCWTDGANVEVVEVEQSVATTL